MIAKMFIILVITVLIVAVGVYGIFYIMTRNAMISDIQQRAQGVKDHILHNINIDELEAFLNGRTRMGASPLLQEDLDRVRDIGNIKNLYIAKIDPSGEIVATAEFSHTAEIEADLRKSLIETTAVMGSGVYQTDAGGVYTVFWPILDGNSVPLGTLGMEFEADSIYDSHNTAALYSIALSGALIFLMFIIAFLSMSRTTEPYYKKLAYTDILTGYENRMAFEHKLRECHAIVQKGKEVALIICDVNNLKTINDEKGHKAGDAYIKSTADTIYNVLSGKGNLYRIGGDEFACIISDRKQAEINKIMDSFEVERKTSKSKYPFDCACGTASYTEGVDSSMRDLFKRADEAMYQEKLRQKGSAR